MPYELCHFHSAVVMTWKRVVCVSLAHGTAE
jgi:hypothetical protein